MKAWIMGNGRWLLNLAVAVALVAAGWFSNGWRLGAEIERMRADTATQREQSASAALDTLAATQAGIASDAAALAQTQRDLKALTTQFSRSYRNAAASHPLPADCRIDPERLRILKRIASEVNATAGLGQPHG